MLTERGLKMTTRPTTSPTKKLAQLKEKMSALRQEEEKICQNLAQELSQCLINAQALEIDFDVFVGGMLEVITQAQANSNKIGAWQKSGQKFRQYQSRINKSKEGQKRDPHSAPSQTVPQSEKVA